MTQRGDPKLFKVLVCQIGQDAELNIVLGKLLSILPKAEPPKPIGNLLHRGTVLFCSD